MPLSGQVIFSIFSCLHFFPLENPLLGDLNSKDAVTHLKMINM